MTGSGGHPVRRGFSFDHDVSGILDHPPSRVMTVEGMNFPSRKNAIVCAIAMLIPHQPRMRRRDHDVIRHAVEFGVRNRHPSVMRLRQHRPGHWIDRPVSGDDADGIIDRREHCIVHRAPPCAELLSGRSEKGAVGAKILQAVGDFAAAVRRTEHHHAAEAFWPIAGEIDARQQARPWNGRRNGWSQSGRRQTVRWRDECPPPALPAPFGGWHSPD